MTGQVPGLSIVFMAVTALFCIAAPFVLLAVFRKKGADVFPFFIGCAVFVVFALILESLAHNIILSRLPVGQKIRENTLYYALYGGLMAGLFEETGRFTAFKTVLRKRLENDRNALQYGAGHGGIEALLLVGFSYVSNLIVSVLINSGQLDMITAQLAGTAADQMKAAVDTLVTTSPWTYLLAMAERAVAVTAHICLSVIVWFAAKKPGKGWLYPLAILIHAAFDAVTVLLAANLSLPATEGCLAVMAVLMVLTARGVWRKNTEV